MKHIGAIAVVALTVLSGCDGGDVETIGPRGGTVVSEDGRFSLDIPAGALEEQVEISVEVVECEAADSVGPCYDVMPHGVGFLYPATVTFELGGMELGPVDPHSLGFIAEREEGWNVLADQEVDMDDQIVVASAMYLSSYAVVPVQ